MLCDGRLVCGCADPYGKRVLGDARDGVGLATSGPGRSITALRADLNAGGSKFCGDCPLKLPLKKDEAPPPRPLDAGAAARRGCTSSARPPATSRAPGVLRAGNRHHPHAPGRHARLRSVPPRRSTRPARRSSASTSSTTAKRSCTSARSRCASTSSRASRTSISTRAPTAWRSPRTQARRLVHSGIDEVTFSIDGATAGQLREVPAARRLRHGDRQPAGDGRREAPSRPRPAVPQLALHPVQVERQRRGDGRARAQLAADIGVDRLCWEITDHPEDAYLAPLRARLAGLRRRSATRSGTTTTSATRSPARRRAREIDVRTSCRCPALPLDRPRAGRAARRSGRASATCRRARSRRRRATAGGWSALGAQLCARGRHAHQPRLRARLAARARSRPARRADVADHDCRRREQPGRYALKFDLVSEGIDWFEACGSRDDDEAAGRVWVTAQQASQD